MLKIQFVAAAALAMTSAGLAADGPDTSTWVRFSSFRYTGKAATTPKEGEYLNPVLAGSYPDPSVCRVGDDYYLVNSAGTYFPGIPIWHSKDLLNWVQIGNVLDRSSQFATEYGKAVSTGTVAPPTSDDEAYRQPPTVYAGTYAPTIRFHDGTFYVTFTFMEVRGDFYTNPTGHMCSFYVTAKDPKGPWSEPIQLNGVGGIHPSLFFDDDGKCYLTYCDRPADGGQYLGHFTILLQELDLSQKRLVGGTAVIIDHGTNRQAAWCEAPHLYKIKGTYYLMCAQGSHWDNYSSEVIFKSDSLRGPYVPWEKNPILTAADLPDNRPNPVICTGHADLVQTPNGQWYAVFMGCQPYQPRDPARYPGYYNTGGQTFMLPVKWEGQWPVILPPRTPVPLTVMKPNLPAGPRAAVPCRGDISYVDDFDSDSLAFRWIALRAPTSDWYAVSKSSKALFLQPGEPLAGLRRKNVSFLAVRQQNENFSCEVILTAQPKTAGCVAGLAAYCHDYRFYALSVRINSGRVTEIWLGLPPYPPGGRGGAPYPTVPAAQELPGDATSITLKIEGKGPVTKCFYKTGNGEFVRLGEDLPSSFLGADPTGPGVTLGMFASTDEVPSNQRPPWKPGQ